MSAVKYETSCVERFLEYVRFDTQSREGSDVFPSTPGQRVLLERLVGDLRGIGLADASIDEHGYVFATIPATSSRSDLPTIGFLAHVDTSPEMPGAGVVPIVHRGYDGTDIRLPDDESAVLRMVDNPALEEQLGNDIITASGTTLLGADNKAGVAEIVGAAEYLMAHPEIPHGPIRLGFTPDEEIGIGTKYFDVERFGAACAYTMDGGRRGELQIETFSADSITVVFEGFNTHPGYAKGKMVNAIKLAGRFLARLPEERLTPETTGGHEGFVHPYVMEASVERTSIRLLARDFDTAKMKEHERFVSELAGEVASELPGASVDCRVEESYRNMKEVLDRHPGVVAHAREAIERTGLTVHQTPIRGGTDGARLCFMGLPTPNVFCGQHNFHSRLEWVSAQDMHKAVETIVEIARVWEERS